MPRHDWHDDDRDLMSRDRDYEDMRRDRDYRSFDERGRDRGAMFGGDRGELRVRRPMTGWGSLLNDESSGSRSSYGRERSDYGRERHFGPDDERGGIPIDETERLIASNKVEGTPVYDRHGDRLGSVHNFMVDKFRGQVVYAVLKHSSGFLGLDERYYPLEWSQLTFDTRLGGYHIDMTEDQLMRLGSWDRNQRWQARGGETGRGRFDRDDERGRDFERRPMRESW